MLITRETDYALRIIRVLRDGELHTVGELAQGELVPQPFAYKILKKLDSARIIEILRGSNGGCRLSADLSRVSLYDLMKAVGDGGALSACMDPEYHCPWRSEYGVCSVHCKLLQIQEKLNQELRANSLENLLGED